MKISFVLPLVLTGVLGLHIGAPVIAVSQTEGGRQKVSSDTRKNRSEAIDLLREMKSHLKEDYYDPKFHGIDIDARFAAAEERIKTLQFNWQMYRVLVQVLMDLDDSHTRFSLPPRTDFFDYGFSMQMIGNNCFVTSIKKGSDAESKGLMVGDRILTIGKHQPDRDNLWKIIYVLYKLDPTNSVTLKVVTLAGEEKSLTILAKTMTQKERREELQKKKLKEEAEPYKCSEINPQLIACKLTTFVVPRGEIDKMMKEVGSHRQLILDLRGNGGGYVSAEEELVSHFFRRDVKIADIVRRRTTETRMAKSKGNKSYDGELLVLTDSRSASASEMFSRVIQIEKRGKVVGDVTAGALMTSIFVPLFGTKLGLTAVGYSSVAMNLTIGDVVMSDGGRVEKIGVIPDFPVRPTAMALSKRLDVVLSYAAGKFGAKLTPEDATKLHFNHEKYDDEDLPSEPDADK